LRGGIGSKRSHGLAGGNHEKKAQPKRDGIYFTTERFAAAALPRSICTLYLIFWPSFVQSAQAGALDRRDVHEHILAAVIGWMKP